MEASMAAACGAITRCAKSWICCRNSSASSSTALLAAVCAAKPRDAHRAGLKTCRARESRLARRLARMVMLGWVVGVGVGRSLAPLCVCAPPQVSPTAACRNYAWYVFGLAPRSTHTNLRAVLRGGADSSSTANITAQDITGSNTVLWCWPHIQRWPGAPHKNRAHTANHNPVHIAFHSLPPCSATTAVASPAHNKSCCLDTALPCQRSDFAHPRVATGCKERASALTTSANGEQPHDEQPGQNARQGIWRTCHSHIPVHQHSSRFQRLRHATERGD